MKILLLNENPVVNKLVTLSAQKTSDELEIADSLDSATGTSYDLVVVDDTVFSDSFFGELQDKISFSKSLYICSRDAEHSEEFTSTIKKPFLPTDLVELFASLGREVSKEALNKQTADNTFMKDEEEPDLDIDEEVIDDLEDLEDLGSEISFDDELLSEDEDINEDADTLVDEMNLDDLDEELSSDESQAGVLDKDELEEVQSLLNDDDDEDEIDLELDDELDLDDLDFDDELEEDSEELQADEDETDISDELDDLDLDDLDLEDESADDSKEDEFDLEDEIEEDIELEEDMQTQEDETDISDELDDLDLDDLDMEDESADDSKEDEFDLEDEIEEDIELEEDMDDELNPEELNLEDQIQNAVGELTQEELDSEIDDETLLDIVSGEMDSLDSLTTRDLKIAVGEEVEDIADEDFDLGESFDETEDDTAGNQEKSNNNDELDDISTTQITPDNDGVEALKKLLKALSNEDVAASMKGMKININITLGDN